MLKNLPIKLKLLLLAGVPVLGALLLSYLVALDAQRRLESAKALGSIEDLAHLAATISKTVDTTQAERAKTAYALGRQVEDLNAELRQVQSEVDAQVDELAQFFASRDTKALPSRLAQGIHKAQEMLAKRHEVRKDLGSEDAKLEDLSTLIDQVNSELIGATAALTSLSDDGVMLRNISGLVAVMELKERASREQALLAYVFAKSAYPPGGYKSMVNLVTEQEVFDQVLRRSTSSDLVRLYDGRMKGKETDRALELRQIGLDTMDDNFGVNPDEWLRVQGAKVEILRGLTMKLNERVKDAALLRLRSAKEAVQTSFLVSAGILLTSVLLAIIIALQIGRAVHALADAAHDVQHKQDFSVRAEKKSEDELGKLTDAFNHMLDGIQKRDQELEDHRANLEKTVEARTAELAKRNEAMRVVLDNVEQGLATIKPDGTLENERSAMFDTWFEGAKEKVSPQFADVLAANDNNMKAMLELGWEGLTDGFLPLGLAADQIPKRIDRDGRKYELAYKPMGTEGDFRGALLMVSDITQDEARKKKEAEQREMIAVFEAVMKDRTGFIEFFNDTERLVVDIVEDRITEEVVLKRVIHTVKGNSAIYGISSVSHQCHLLEQACIDEKRRPNGEELTRLADAWASFAERVRLFADQSEDDVVEVRYPELENLISAAKARKPHAQLVEALQALKHEPTEVRFERINQQAARLAKKLGKEGVVVEIVGNQVRLPADRWGNFWSAFIHVVRNALDHGIETTEERLSAGKQAQGKISLISRIDGSYFVIEMSDDGRGIDWEKVKEKAHEKGLATATRSDLVDALFSDGLSTRDEASDTSGRGVGMSAVKQACEAMNGTVSVSSVAGKGTAIRFRIPVSGNDLPSPTSARPGVRPSIAPPPSSLSGNRQDGGSRQKVS